MFTADELRSVLDLLNDYAYDFDLQLRTMQRDLALQERVYPDVDFSDEYYEINYHAKYLSEIKRVLKMVSHVLHDVDVSYPDDCLPF